MWSDSLWVVVAVGSWVVADLGLCEGISGLLIFWIYCIAILDEATLRHIDVFGPHGGDRCRVT